MVFSFSKIDSTFITIVCFVWAGVIVWSLCVSFQCMCMQVDCSSRCPFFRFKPDCVAVVCSLCLLSTDLGKTSRKARIELLIMDNLRHVNCRIQQKSVIQTFAFIAVLLLLLCFWLSVGFAKLFCVISISHFCLQLVNDYLSQFFLLFDLSLDHNALVISSSTFVLSAEFRRSVVAKFVFANQKVLFVSHDGAC